MMLKLKVATGEVVDFKVLFRGEVGLEDNRLIAPGSGSTTLDVWIGEVEGVVRPLLIDESNGDYQVGCCYLIHKVPYDVTIEEVTNS